MKADSNTATWTQHPSLLPKQDIDWTLSWRNNVVSDAEWRQLRVELGREAAAWAEALSAPRQVSDVEARWLAASVAHLAYHMGAIRQIDRATRGPTAEDEARASRARTGGLLARS